MKMLDKYMPIAVDVVEDVLEARYTKVQKEWDNTVTNFGAAIRQMGLYTAVTAFSAKKTGSKVDRALIPAMLLRIIRLADNNIVSREETLLGVLGDESTNQTIIKKQVNDAVVALKLALRLFMDPKEKEETDNGE